tara:strand:- start:276 stop:590 length:315 start_codon:yes stop_codon:yes gene_type:complete
MNRGALRSALTNKVVSKGIRIVNDFVLPTHKTKELRQILQKLEAKSKLLIVNNGENENLARASGNLAKVKLVSSREVTVYDLLNSQSILFSKAAIEQLQEGLQS